MDPRLVHTFVKDLCRRRVPSILARVVGTPPSDSNPHNADFIHHAGHLTGYRAPDGNIAVMGTTDPQQQALMRELTASAYAQEQERSKRSVAATTKPLSTPALLALIDAYIHLIQLGNPEHPLPRNADDKAWTLANNACRHDPVLHDALCKATRAQRMLARAIALEACADALEDAKKSH